MLLEKYAPKSTKELIGNRLAALELSNFLKHWKKGQAALVCGEPGTGKTLAARLAAREMGYEVVEIGADQQRGMNEMGSFLEASKQAGLRAKKKMFLIDELDQIESTKALERLIKESSHPVVLVTNNPYERKLFGIRKGCRLVRFQRVRHDSIARLLLDVSAREGIACDARHAAQIAKMSGGDVRAALIDLEAFHAGKRGLTELGHREQSQGILDALKIIFKTNSLENALIAMNSAADKEELHRWIAENVAEEYEDAEDLAAAYEALSRADIFYSRVMRRQSWQLQKYFFQLGAGGTALSKKKPYRKFVKYAKPKFRYITGGEGAMKAAKKLHVSSRRLGAYKPLLEKMQKNRKLLDELGMTRDEIREILQSKI